MKTVLLLFIVTSCACPTTVYRKCLEWRTETYMGTVGRSGTHFMHRDVCAQYSDQVYVNYNCKTYKLGEECKDEN